MHFQVADFTTNLNALTCLVRFDLNNVFCSLQETPLKIKHSRKLNMKAWYKNNNGQKICCLYKLKLYGL